MQIKNIVLSQQQWGFSILGIQSIYLKQTLEWLIKFKNYSSNI